MHLLQLHELRVRAVTATGDESCRRQQLSRGASTLQAGMLQLATSAEVHSAWYCVTPRSHLRSRLSHLAVEAQVSAVDAVE